MKKLITLIAMFAIAGIVSADVVNGDFSSATFSDDNVLNHVNIDAGWFGSETAAWGISGGKMVRDVGVVGNGARSFGQMLNDTSLTAGDYTLELDLDYTANTSFVRIDLYSWDNNGDGGSIPITIDLNLSSLNHDIGTAGNYTAYHMASTTITDSFTGKVSVDFTLTHDITDARDLFGIRILTDDGPIAVSVDNVSIVPEPATVGMLGLGALVALLVRRIRA